MEEVWRDRSDPDGKLCTPYVPTGQGQMGSRKVDVDEVEWEGGNSH